MEATKKNEGNVFVPKLLFMAFLLLLGHLGAAQTLVFTGTISAGEAENLPSATVKLLSAHDSAAVATTVTDVDGRFILVDSFPQSSYILKASYMGYRDAYRHLVVIQESDTISVGTLKLRASAIHLQEVTITERRDPIVVTEDTIEYRVESFPTMPHANVESLLRKIPGLEVGRDGSINAGGEPVARIYVNGKEAFGNDLQLITQNFPAEAIDKVQIIDDKSHSDRFSSMESGQTAKAINIQLKPDYQKMRFGSISGGIGDNERYAGEGKYNRFNNGNQLTAIGRSNNINNLDLNGFGTPQTPEAMEGLSTSHSGAINFFKNLSERFSVNGSYHGHASEDIFDSHLTRQTFLPDGIATFSDRNEQTTETIGHQAVTGMVYTDSSNSLRITVSGNLSDITSSGRSLRQSQSPDLANGYTGERDYAIDNANASGNGLFFYGHKFKRRGRTISVDADYSLNDNRLENASNNQTLYLDGTIDSQNQLNAQSNHSAGYRATVSYTEPFGRRQQVKVFYSLSDRQAKSPVNFFDYSEGIPLLNTERSNAVQSDFSYQQAGVTYQFKGKGLTFSAGSDVQEATLSRKHFEDDGRFDQTFQSVLPHALLAIKLSNHSRLNIRYNTAVREPSLNELQPLESWTDPLNIYLPNPNLRPEYTHQGHINFTTAGRRSKSFFLSASVRGSYVSNPITHAVTIEEQQRRRTQYVNTESAHSAAGNIHMTVPIQKLNSSLKVVSFTSYRGNINFVNGLESPRDEVSYGGNIAYGYVYKEILDFNLFASCKITSLKNSAVTPPSQMFFETMYSAEAETITFKRIRIGGSFSYLRLQNPAFHFDEYFPMLNVALGIFLSKKQAAELSIAGNNILSHPTAAQQSADVNFTEQRINETILGRFFMIRFIYHFNSTYHE